MVGYHYTYSLTRSSMTMCLRSGTWFAYGSLSFRTGTPRHHRRMRRRASEIVMIAKTVTTMGTTWGSVEVTTVRSRAPPGSMDHLSQDWVADLAWLSALMNQGNMSSWVM